MGLHFATARCFSYGRWSESFGCCRGRRIEEDTDKLTVGRPAAIHLARIMLRYAALLENAQARKRPDSRGRPAHLERSRRGQWRHGNHDLRKAALAREDLKRTKGQAPSGTSPRGARVGQGAVWRLGCVAAADTDRSSSCALRGGGGLGYAHDLLEPGLARPTRTAWTTWVGAFNTQSAEQVGLTQPLDPRVVATVKMRRLRRRRCVRRC